MPSIITFYDDQVGNQTNGCLCAKYEMWREATTDIIAIVAIYDDILQMQNGSRKIKRYYCAIAYGNTNAGKQSSVLIAYIALTQPKDIGK